RSFTSAASAGTAASIRSAARAARKYERDVFMLFLSGSCRRAAHPFIETDVAEARFAQRDERALLDTAAPVPRLGVTHDLMRVADRFQIAGDDLVERRSFRAGDLDDAVSWRRERRIGNDGSNVVRGDRLEQAG